jgi:hypothetical protein
MLVRDGTLRLPAVSVMVLAEAALLGEKTAAREDQRVAQAAGGIGPGSGGGLHRTI